MYLEFTHVGQHLIFESLAERIVDQIESDHIVVVCKKKDESAVRAIAKQIGWGRRVRGIVTEKDLIGWYNKCLRGAYSEELAKPLMDTLRTGFVAEFPQLDSIRTFMDERNYSVMKPIDLWRTGLERR